MNGFLNKQDELLSEIIGDLEERQRTQSHPSTQAQQVSPAPSNSPPKPRR